MPAALTDHYRCPSDLVSFGVTGQLSSSPDFFELEGITCYGRRSVRSIAATTDDVEIAREVFQGVGRVCLPFDFSEVVANLQLEHYRLTRHGLFDRVSGAGAAPWMSSSASG